MLRLKVDAIVNSAHRDMGGGGGSMYICLAVSYVLQLLLLLLSLS